MWHATFLIGSVLTNSLSGVPLALEEPSQAGANSVYEIGAYAVSQPVAQAGVAALFRLLHPAVR
ncbi:MAG: hypothetical protein R2845_07200 [Thermomicrobiales bacterium]